MAFVTKFEVDTGLEIVENFLPRLESIANVNAIKGELTKKIQALKKVEEKFFNLLGITGEDSSKKIKEFRERVQKAQLIMSGFESAEGEFQNIFKNGDLSPEDQKKQLGIKEFHQGGLEEAFIKEARQQAKKLKNKENSKFIELLKKDIQAIGVKKRTDIIKVIADILNYQKISLGKGSHQVKITKNLSNIKTLNDITYSTLTEAQKAKGQIYMASGGLPIEEINRLRKKYDPKAKEITPEDIKTTISQNQSGVQIDTWYSYTDFKKQTEIDSEKDEKEIKRIKENILNFIQHKVGGNQYAMTSAKAVLDSSPKSVFVGKNTNDISGLLGEIEAHALFSILFQKPVGASVKVDWIGGIVANKGKKPHEDLKIIANNFGYGIQVKNTTKDLLGGEKLNPISFYSRNAESFFEPLSSSFGATMSLLLPLIYEMEAFNVPYIEEGEVYKKVASSPDFSERTQIEEYANLANRALSAYAATFMFMQLEEGAAKLPTGNIIYLIGGLYPLMASEILADIQNNLESNQRNFRIKGSFSGKTAKSNIVDYFNSNKRNRNQRLDSQGSLVLTSEYDFNPLISSYGF